MLVADYLLLNRLRLGNVYDVLYVYAYAFLYIAFNVVYTLWIPGATNPDGGGLDGVEVERNYVLRELYVNTLCIYMYANRQTKRVLRILNLQKKRIPKQLRPSIPSPSLLFLSSTCSVRGVDR